MKLSRFFFIALLSLNLLPQSAQAILCKLTFGNRSPEVIQSRFLSVFKTANPIIAMIHLAGKGDAEAVDRAMAELQILSDFGAHAAIIENYHGSRRKVELVLRQAQGKFPKLAIGVNILPNEYKDAFELATKYGAKFIQIDYVSGKYYASPGIGTIALDYQDYQKVRRQYDQILVLGGVHPKYYFPVYGSNLVHDLRVAQWLADAVVVTGAGTGKETPIQKIREFREILGENFPLVIGAGVTVANAFPQLLSANGAIIGSYFKDGNTEAPIMPLRVENMKRMFDWIEGAKKSK